MNNIKFKLLENIGPDYYFKNKDFNIQKNYTKGFLINKLFSLNNVGIVTSKDSTLINNDANKLISNVEFFYKIKGNHNYIKKISYRPFDTQYIYYDVKIIERAREKVMQHFLERENVGLVTVNRQPLSNPTSYYFITSNIISNGYIRSDSVSIDSILPLYLYNDKNIQLSTDTWIKRTPNLNEEIVQQIATGVGLTFTNEKEQTQNTFAPIDLLDYIYAVLHSPSYREKYKEFLKIDFPRVPYPTNAGTFWQLVKLGGEIRQLHLLESNHIDNYITTYPQDGDNVVTAPKHEVGRVYINPSQYFEGVPESTWQFYIGGYQPAQKWLKDRKGRELSFDDILHYQRMIVALSETERLMGEIDKIEIE